MLRIPGQRVGAHDHVIGLGAGDVVCRGIELQVDRRDERSELVAAGNQPSIDLANVGPVRVSADHDIDGLVQFRDDLDDGARNTGTLIVVAARQTTLVDKENDRLDASRLQLRHQRVHRLRLVAEFEAGNALRRNDARRAPQGQPDKGDRNALEFPDLIGRKNRLAGILVEGAGGEIMKLGAGERVRSLTFVGRMAAAILHPEQFVLAFVEFVIAHGSDFKPHHRQRFDRGLIVKHRRQKRTGADQVAGGDKDRVAGLAAKLIYQRRHVFDATGRHRHLFGFI